MPNNVYYNITNLPSIFFKLLDYSIFANKRANSIHFVICSKLSRWLMFLVDGLSWYIPRLNITDFVEMVVLMKQKWTL